MGATYYAYKVWANCVKIMFEYEWIALIKKMDVQNGYFVFIRVDMLPARKHFEKMKEKNER